jgi:hypothetical protein
MSRSAHRNFSPSAQMTDSPASCLAMSEGQNVIPHACRLRAGHARASPASDSPGPVCAKQPRAVPRCRFVKWRQNCIVHHNANATRSYSCMTWAFKVCWCLSLIQMSFLQAQHTAKHQSMYPSMMRRVVMCWQVCPAQQKARCQQWLPRHTSRQVTCLSEKTATPGAAEVLHLLCTAMHPACRKHCCCVLLFGTLTLAIDKSSAGRSSGCP